MATLTDIYPLYALQVTAGDLQLRVVRDDDIPELVALAQDGDPRPGRDAVFLSLD